MTKLSFLLLLYLLCFCNLSAQTDSATSHTDSTIRRDLPVRHALIRHDSAGHSRDSLRRDGVRPDSLFRAGAVGRTGVDTSSRHGVSADTAARSRNIRGDSTPGHDMGVLSGALPISGEQAGPPPLTFWMAVLSANPSFNFTGRPVPQPFQLYRPNSKDSLFYLLLGILFYFALVRIFFEKYFGNLMTLFFRVSLRQQQIREQVLQTPLPSLLLNLLFIITGGLYASFLLHYSRFGPVMNFWLLYVNCMGGLLAVYLLKFLTLKFCGWVFTISRATDTYIFVVFLVNKMAGIFLLPFLILITFSSREIREILITISLAMFFILLAYRVLAAYRPVRNEIKLTPFHFFLYLCAFEIAPLLLIYKVLLTYLEKVY